MTNLHNHVPEPDQQKKNKSDQAPPHVHQLPISSSEDDSADESALTDMSGYLPLSQLVIDGGSSEFHAQAFDSSSDEEVSEDHGTNSAAVEEMREIAMDADLILNAMKGVSLSGSSIPPWAKELSDGEWDDLVKRTISGEKGTGTATPSDVALPAVGKS